MLFTLTAVYAVNFVDRQLVVILQEAIKVDLQLSDTQLGLLSGLAFALFYVTAGIPIARIADTHNRRNVISLALGLWSGMTVLCGYAANFFQLLLARMGVGVGEAGCSPPAHSIISDMYPPQRRATALSIYSVGINIGIMVGFILGGILNSYYGWRTAFIVVGAPGILLAIWVRATIEEPIRGAFDTQPNTTEQGSLLHAVQHIYQNKALWHLCIAAGLCGLVGYGLTNWIPSFYIRVHGVDTAELGVWLAIGAGVFGGLGTFLFGYLADRLGARDRRWYMWLPCLGIIVFIPIVCFVTFTPHRQAALVGGLLLPFFTTAYLGATLAVLHSSFEPRMRATASAILFLVINVVGLGIGPPLIGFISDILEPSLHQFSLRYTFVLVLPVTSVWAAAHFLIAAKNYSQ